MPKITQTLEVAALSVPKVKWQVFTDNDLVGIVLATSYRKAYRAAKADLKLPEEYRQLVVKPMERPTETEEWIAACACGSPGCTAKHPLGQDKHGKPIYVVELPKGITPPQAIGGFIPGVKWKRVADL